jgi:cytochrome c-type biogenesis protein
MVDAPNLLLAFAAGFVSFVSPCCLPLVPGYLAVVTGGSASDGGPPSRTVVTGRALLFVASFSLVFIVLGLSATALGALLFDNQLTLRKVAGVAIALMGLLFIASVFIVRLNRDWRPAGLVRRAGRGGPVLAGVAFAVAWTPCVGPTLGAILGLASTSQSTAQAGGLLLVYSAGLAVPFLLSALGFGSARGGFGWFKRHHVGVQVTAGFVLAIMGGLVFTNQLFQLNIEAQRVLDAAGLNFFQSL